jgi:nucleotide-binding universal stress UspA family protein
MIERVVVGIDGSANSITALEWAAKHAHATRALVEAVYVWHYPFAAIAPAPIGSGAPPPELMEAAAEEALRGFLVLAVLPPGTRIEQIVREGSAAKVLLDRADEAQLLVVGARGHGGFRGLLSGSVATAVAAHAPCPVVVVPG